MINIMKPVIIDIDTIVSDEKGKLSAAENGKIPFQIKRVFWTHDLPEDTSRGYHAHRETFQILIALSGTIHVELEDAEGHMFKFKLDSADKGLLIPPQYWHVMYYKKNVIQLVLASHEYNEADYLRRYNDFKEYWKNKQ